MPTIFDFYKYTIGTSTKYNRTSLCNLDAQVSNFIHQHQLHQQQIQLQYLYLYQLFLYVLVRASTKRDRGTQIKKKSQKKTPALLIDLLLVVLPVVLVLLRVAFVQVSTTPRTKHHVHICEYHFMFLSQSMLRFVLIECESERIRSSVRTDSRASERQIRKFANVVLIGLRISANRSHMGQNDSRRYSTSTTR
jgi:hypothetical protein